jgi:hypothetical protein
VTGLWIGPTPEIRSFAAAELIKGQMGEKINALTGIEVGGQTFSDQTAKMSH